MQAAGKAEIEVADGTVIDRELTTATLEIEGRRGTVMVYIARNGQVPLVGYTTLQLLGSRVRPVTRKLEPARHIEYR